MKNKMVSILILALLSLWVPCASAEIDQELDPMVPADVQATVAEEASVSGAATGQTSNVASTANAAASDKKKGEVTKKEKSKKSSKKKSSDSKKKKTSSKSAKKHSTSAN
ncbi:MAG: hypothetical protein WCJ71_02460 [Candidatus Omnitrophota bacterium]